MKTGVESYKIGQKNNWRNWAWNRLIEMIQCPAKDAIVLYLPSSEDLDRKVAISKGFKPDNLLAVESDPGKVRGLRNRGINAINADLSQVVLMWGSALPISGIIADYCCGITRQVVNFLDVLKCSNSIADPCGIIVNLMRGRDPYSTLFRKTIRSDEFIERTVNSLHASRPYLRRENVDGFMRGWFKDMNIHRGKQFYWLLHITFMQNAELNGLSGNDIRQLRTLLDKGYKTVNSYNSSNNKSHVKMDTVAFQWWPFGDMVSDDERRRLLTMMRDPDDRIKNKIASWKAIRTMRLNG